MLFGQVSKSPSKIVHSARGSVRVLLACVGQVADDVDHLKSRKRFATSWSVGWKTESAERGLVLTRSRNGAVQAGFAKIMRGLKVAA